MWVAPLIYLAVTVLLWQLGGGLFLPELLANRLFEILPAATIESGVQRFGALAKPIAFYIISTVYFGFYFLFARFWERLRPYLGNTFYAGFVLWGAHVLLLIPALGQRVFGSKLPQGGLIPSVFLFVSHW